MKIRPATIAVTLAVILHVSVFAQESSDNTNVIGLLISSNNDGQTLIGTVTYSAEGPTPFKGTSYQFSAGENIAVKNSLGTDWQHAGHWVIGGREDQHVTSMDVRSKDNGETLTGKMAYEGEGKISVRAIRGNGVPYLVEHPSNGNPVSGGGTWVLGGRGDRFQYIAAIDISSSDKGRSFEGTIQYDGEGPLDFRATQLAGNGYRAEVYFGRDWHSEGDWIIGCHEDRAVEVSAKSNDGGRTLTGSVIYRRGGRYTMKAKISSGSAYTIENRWGADWNPGGVFVLGNRKVRSGSSSGDTYTNSIGMQLRRIKAGTFMMGSPDSEDGRDDDEVRHEVTLTSDYFLGVTEVTQSQWEQVMGTTPWAGRDRAREGTDFAASYITWNEATEFCEKLSRREARTYRLPTEAEWEYACRAGTSTAYSFGGHASLLHHHGWFEDNAENIGRYYAHRVAQKQPNGFGLYDMHGNVYEYCQDWFDDYPAGHVTDPTGPDDGTRRVMRSGGIGSSPNRLRSAYRSRRELDSPFYGSGLRVLLVPETGASIVTSDPARQIIGKWKPNAAASAKQFRVDIDLKLSKVLSDLTVEITSNELKSRFEGKVVGSTAYKIKKTGTFGNLAVLEIPGQDDHEILILNENRIAFELDGVTMVFDRIGATFTLKQAEELLIGTWRSNLAASEEFDQRQTVPFPAIDTVWKMEFLRQKNGEILMGGESSSGLANSVGSLRDGDQANCFHLGNLHLHFLSKDRLVYLREGRVAVVLDRTTPE